MMGKLLQRLQDPKRSGVYRSARIDEVAGDVEGTRLSLVEIVVGGKPALLESIAKALEFPDWFGENWDALEDCLTDLSWRKAAGHVLVFEGIGALPADERGTLIDVLASAAQFWAGQGTPFFAVFVDPDSRLELPDLRRAA